MNKSLLPTVLLITALPVLAAAAASAAAADTGASDASVLELLDLMQSRQLLDESLSQMDTVMHDSMRQALAGRNLSSAQQQIVSDMQSDVLTLLKGELQWADMKPEFVRIYRQAFSPAEIAAMLKFYRSPAGRAVVAKLPQVSQLSLQLVGAKLKTIMPKVQEIERESMQKLQAAATGETPSGNSAPPDSGAPASDAPAADAAAK